MTLSSAPRVQHLRIWLSASRGLPCGRSGRTEHHPVNEGPRRRDGQTRRVSGLSHPRPLHGALGQGYSAYGARMAPLRLRFSSTRFTSPGMCIAVLDESRQRPNFPASAVRQIGQVGPLRRSFPWSADLSAFRIEDLEHVGHELMGCRRKTLGWEIQPSVSCFANFVLNLSSFATTVRSRSGRPGCGCGGGISDRERLRRCATPRHTRGYCRARSGGSSPGRPSWSDRS